MKKTTISLFLFSMILAISCQQSELAQPKSNTKNARNSASSLAITEIVPLNGTANLYNYEDIQIAFTKWILGPGFNDGPLADPDGSRHEAGFQPLPGIMILGSNFGGESTRSVTVPADSYVYLPVFGTTTWKYNIGEIQCDPSKIPDGHPLKTFLNSYLKPYYQNQKPAYLVAKVDGMDIVPDLSKYLTITSPFQLTINNDFNNPACDYTGKIATAVGMNYGIVIKLSPGTHTIVYSGLSTNKKFYSGVTWNIMVE